MSADGFVRAWSRDTGREQLVPEHYQSNPLLGRGLTFDPVEGRDAAKAFSRDVVLTPVEEPATAEQPAGFGCDVPGCDFVAKTERALKGHTARTHKVPDVMPDLQQTPDADSNQTLVDDPETTQSVDNPKE